MYFLQLAKSWKVISPNHMAIDISPLLHKKRFDWKYSLTKDKTLFRKSCYQIYSFNKKNSYYPAVNNRWRLFKLGSCFFYAPMALNIHFKEKMHYICLCKFDVDFSLFDRCSIKKKVSFRRYWALYQFTLFF